jgi:hypothetical protein
MSRTLVQSECFGSNGIFCNLFSRVSEHYPKIYCGMDDKKVRIQIYFRGIKKNNASSFYNLVFEHRTSSSSGLCKYE